MSLKNCWTPEPYLLLPINSMEQLLKTPRDELLIWSVHGDNPERELIEEMELANNAGDNFLAGRIDFSTYCDILESLGISDPYELLAEVIEPYSRAGMA